MLYRQSRAIPIVSLCTVEKNNLKMNESPEAIVEKTTELA